MKRLLFSSCLAAMWALSGCTHSAKVATTTTPITTPVTPGPSGSWKVSYFNNYGSDETALFGNYRFEFPSSGGILSIENGVTETGTFTQATDGGIKKITINFSSNPSARLNNDWTVTTNTTTEIDLKKGSSTDELHFTKQ